MRAGTGCAAALAGAPSCPRSLRPQAKHSPSPLTPAACPPPMLSAAQRRTTCRVRRGRPGKRCGGPPPGASHSLAPRPPLVCIALGCPWGPAQGHGVGTAARDAHGARGGRLQRRPRAGGLHDCGARPRPAPLTAAVLGSPGMTLSRAETHRGRRHVAGARGRRGGPAAPVAPHARPGSLPPRLHTLPHRHRGTMLRA